MRRNLIVRLFGGLVVLWLSLSSLAFGPPKLVESDTGDFPIYGADLQLISESAPPKQMGTAELIMDEATGKVVYQRNANNRVAPASTTKIMTAIVALEQGNLTDTITITNDHMVEGSIMGLLPGDVVTLEDLLWGLLLPSGNDAALAIADLVGKGSVEYFVFLMNEKVAELGLQDTNFTNPHGLDEDGHYSSAYDLAVMGRYAMSKPVFAEMVATQRKVVQANRTLILDNTNQLLRQQGLNVKVGGIKTGFTENAGDCLVAAVERNGRQMIIVVMGSQGRVQAAKQLADYAFSNFTWVPLRPPLVSGATGADGSRLPVEPYLWEMTPLWQRYYVNSAVFLEKKAPDNRLGTATYTVGGVPVAEIGLYARAP